MERIQTEIFADSAGKATTRTEVTFNSQVEKQDISNAGKGKLRLADDAANLQTQALITNPDFVYAIRVLSIFADDATLKLQATIP